MKLEPLTREAYNSNRNRFKRFLRFHGPTLIISVALAAYPTWRWTQADTRLSEANKAIYRLAHESAMKGCASFQPSTTIIISASTPEGMRKELNRVAHDVDTFNVALSEALKGKQ